MTSSWVAKAAVAVLALGAVVGVGVVHAEGTRQVTADPAGSSAVVTVTPSPSPAATQADVTWGG